MKKLFLGAVFSAMLLIGVGWFLAPCLEYNKLSEDIREAELRGESEYFDETANCLMPNWCRDGYQERYNAAVEAKKTFIEENDVAKWISTSATTSTGSVIRLLVIGIAMLVALAAGIILICSILLLVARIIYLIRRRRRKRRKPTPKKTVI